VPRRGFAGSGIRNNEATKSAVAVSAQPPFACVDIVDVMVLRRLVQYVARVARLANSHMAASACRDARSRGTGVRCACRALLKIAVPVVNTLRVMMMLRGSAVARRRYYDAMRGGSERAVIRLCALRRVSPPASRRSRSTICHYRSQYTGYCYD